jgi:host factor-I protein
MAKSILNIQDSFLNQARKDKVGISVHLIDGSSLSGKITAFDNFTMIIMNEDKDEQYLIYKHSIATMTPKNKVRWNIAGGPRDERDRERDRDRPPRPPRGNG